MDQPLPFEIPNVTVLLQPEEQVLEIPRHKVKNVKQLLKYLGIRECTALVARGRRGGASCLTPDRAVLPHDNLLVRKVTSERLMRGGVGYWGGRRTFLEKVLLPPQTPTPSPKTFDWWEAARREFVPSGGKGEMKAVCGVLLSFQGKTEGTLRREQRRV